MRQILFAILISLAIIAPTEASNSTEYLSVEMDSHDATTKAAYDPTQTTYQSATKTFLIVAQNKSDIKAAKAPKDKKPKAPKATTNARSDVYECFDYCSVVRYSCEGLALVQPVDKISRIGSVDNNKWSRDCQKIYIDCMNKCEKSPDKVNSERIKVSKGRLKEVLKKPKKNR